MIFYSWDPNIQLDSFLDIFIVTIRKLIIGTSVGVAVGRRSGGRLATTLVDRYFHHSFLSFFFFLRRLLFS